MQFLAVIAALGAAVFLGSFVVAGISQSVNSLGEFPRNYGYPYQNSQQAAIAAAAAQQASPQVAGAFVTSDELAGDIVSTLNTIPNASHFEQLFKEANGSAYLVQPTLYTLFVPTDEAFAKLPYEQKVAINTMTAEEKVRFVTYHLVPQKMVSVGGQKAGTVTAISLDTLNFELNDNGGTVGNATVVAAYNVGNGIVYVVDSVLLPPQKRVEPGLEYYNY